ncbi:MAG: PAS domain-containing protein [Leptolyngbyaceae cyanobacterium bins.59]|nr:PAS domain-containing protein [Leptolyngbyaceae cyanobacterium bins.59]
MESFQPTSSMSHSITPHLWSFEALLAGMMDGMLVVEESGRLLEVNSAACEWLGLSRSQLLNLSMPEALRSVPTLLEAIQTGSQEPKKLRGIEQFERADGNYGTIEYTVTTHFMPGYHLVILRDRADWDLPAPSPAAQAVSVAHPEGESNSLQAIVRNIPGIVYRIVHYPDGSISVPYISEQCQELLGYTVQEVQTFSVEQFHKIVHPDDLLLLQAQLEVARQTLQSDYLEYRVITQSGSIRWVRDTAHFSWDGQGNFVIDGVALDVSDRKYLEAVLQHSEARLGDILNRASVSIASFRLYSDHTWKYDYYSSGCQSVFGYTPQDMMRGVGWSRIPSEDCQEILLPSQQQILAGESIQIEYRFRHADGSLRWICSTMTSRWNEVTKCQMVISVDTDITNRKQAETALRLQSDRSRLLGTITHHIRESLDLDQVLDTTVQEVLKLLQCDRVLVFRFAPDQTGRVDREARKDDRPSLQGELYLTNCVAIRPIEFQEESPWVIRDANQECASICPVLPLLGGQAQIALPLAHQGIPWGLLIAQQDVELRDWQAWEVEFLTAIAAQVQIAIHQAHLYQQLQTFNNTLENQVHERTLALEQSLKFEALLKTITDKVRDSLDEHQILQSVVSEVGQGLAVECCDVGIYSADQSIATIAYEWTQTVASAEGYSFTVTDCSHADVHHQLLKGESCQFCNLVLNVLRPNHRRYAVLACPIALEQEVLGNLWLFKEHQDTFSGSEVRLVQQVASQCAIALRQSRLYQASQTQIQELERLNQLKDDFLSSVSHELRTPMSNIRMAAQMLEIILQEKIENFAASRVEQYLQILNSECQREINLIGDLLDLTRLNAHTDPLRLTTIQLQYWIPYLAEVFAERARNQQQHLEVNIPESLPSLTTDVFYLERALGELLNNACKYTPADEQILVSAHLIEGSELAGVSDLSSHPEVENSSPQQILIQVTNTGVEIPESEWENVFEKFYRIPNNDPWKHGGTGLGLALVKRLIKRLGGTIAIHSGSGQTSFLIRLPLELVAEA